jgi:hypothetical protein
MIRRRKSDRSVQPFSVTTSDGTTFRCSLSALGREAEPRWVLIDSNGVQYVGPEAGHDKSPDTVRDLVNAWWKARTSEPSNS